MERGLVLSSYKVKKIGDNKPENFIIKYDRALILDKNQQYIIGLNRILNLSFTLFNINGGCDNQLVKYSSDGGKTFKDITFPTGVEDLDNYIKEKNSYKDPT